VAENVASDAVIIFFALPKETTSAPYVFTIASDHQVGRCLGLSG
jgi:hypothetical protein